MSAIIGPDGKARCTWPGLADAQYTTYHDTEWGMPCGDDRKLFEKLILEGFQAGLSWLTILRKRDNFRTAFHGFDAERMVRFTAADQARLMADTGIIRNRAKIEASVDNARAFLKIQERQGLGTFLWDFVDGRPIINTYAAHGDVPPKTELSTKMSKALIAEGFRFVGPTTVYAFMQSMGFVNDHLATCHRHAPCAALQKTWQAPTRPSQGAAASKPSKRPRGSGKVS
jgi:DNA-3-methyladenine glycosylase I